MEYVDAVGDHIGNGKKIMLMVDASRVKSEAVGNFSSTAYAFGMHLVFFDDKFNLMNFIYFPSLYKNF